MKIIVQNKKAFFNYEVLNKLEAGIMLAGDEVKSIRLGNISLAGSFAAVHKGELFLINCNVKPYAQAFDKGESPTKSRKLLVHKRELNKIVGDISRKGLTIVPLRVYLNNKGLIKVELGICRHKKAASKKSELKERDIKRETIRELKGKFKY